MVTRGGEEEEKAPTLTLRLGGEVEELQMTTMESRTSWSEKRGNGEVHGLGGAMARRRLFSAAPARARERIEGEDEWNGKQARPSSARQRATASGRPRRVAATRRPGAVTGRHYAEFKISAFS